MFCPYCLKNNIQNKLVLIGSECYVCENQWCNFCSEEYSNHSVDLNSSFDEFRNESVLLHSSIIDKNTDVNGKEFVKSNVFSVDDNDDELNVYQKNETKYEKPKIENYNKLPEKLSIVNWLSMPCINVQSKIMCFLLLHLDNVFEIGKHELLNQIKEEYSTINRLSSIVNMELANSFSCSFLSKLFEFSQSISPDNIKIPQFDKRIINCINNFMIKKDSKKRLKCKFTSKFHCKGCRTITKENHLDYFINIPFNKSDFTIKKNLICYKQICLKCSRLAQISINITKIPKFLIIHCENNCQEGINRFNINLQVKKAIYPLLCVVESKISYFPCEVIEKNVNYQEILSVENCSQSKIHSDEEEDYVIHYKSIISV